MYVRYLASAIVSLAFNLLTMLLSPLLAALAATFRWPNLPGPLWFFQTHDDWLYGFGWPKPNVPPTWFKRFRIATWWLCRNPGYAFDAYILGHAILDPLDWPHPDEFRYGVFFRYRGGDGVELFSYRHDMPLFGRRYCKIWLGWKQNGGRNVLALNINPFHSWPS